MACRSRPVVLHRFRLDPSKGGATAHTVCMKISLLTSQLSLSELSALRREGEMLNDYSFTDSCDDWRPRSQHVLSPELWPMVLTGISAAWAFGVRTEPSIHTASLIPPHRIRIPRSKLLIVEERALNPGDFWLGEVHGVTTPLRTIYDLLRTPESLWQHINDCVVNMIKQFSFSGDDVAHYIEASRAVPHKRRALLRLSQIAQPSETR